MSRGGTVGEEGSVLGRLALWVGRTDEKYFRSLFNYSILLSF